MTSMVRTAEQILAAAEDGQPSTPTILRWEDPPDRDPRGNHNPQQTQGRYAPLYAALALRPGEWALVYAGDSTRAKTIATAVRFNHDYEAAVRRVGAASHTYARYIGDVG